MKYGLPSYLSIVGFPNLNLLYKTFLQLLYTHSHYWDRRILINDNLNRLDRPKIIFMN